MTRGRALVLLAVAVLALLAAMKPAEDRMTANGAGIVSFELAGSADRSQEIQDEWGEDGRDAARQQLWIDYGFMLAYGAFLVLAAAATRDLARSRGWRRLVAIGAVAVPAGGIAAGCDAIENACLLLTLGGAGAWAPVTATAFAVAKFALLLVAIAYLLAGLAMRLRGRLQPAAP
ncbi:MAG TPA: hypothetical protein VNR67_07670 [Solirubrobacterales bacterium]|nr:hypothetical protein [Solirubrobacterales bacterium]